MAIYEHAEWRGPIPNRGGAMGAVRLGVAHIMQGTLEGTDSWFHDPSAQVSAHFGIGKDGAVYQWVDTSQVAWAEAAFNSAAISVEHEGVSGDSLTLAQQSSLAAIIAWVNEIHGVPIERSTTPAQPGWIGHGELGVAGGNHPDCPGAPILAQLPAVLARAGAPAPSPVSPQEVSMFASDPKTGGYWATDENGDVYAGGGAPFIPGLNTHPDYHAGAAESGGAAPCVGIVYWSQAGQDGIVLVTKPANGTGGWSGTPYSLYRFLRSGQPA